MSRRKNFTIFNLIIILGLLFLTFFIAAVPTALDLTPYILSDNSMDPTYHNGSLVFVKSEDPEQIIVGDVITYFENQGEHIATKRVVAVDHKMNGFLMKGDASSKTEMGLVNMQKMIGVPVFHIPYIGLFLGNGMIQAFNYIMLILALVLTLFGVIPYCYFLFNQGRREKRERTTVKINKLS